MKRSFFQAAVVSIPLYGCTTWTQTKWMEKKAWWLLHKNVASNIELVLETTPNKAAAVRPPNTHRENYQIRRTRHAGHCWRSRDEFISDVLQWTPLHGRAKAAQPARTYIQQLCVYMGCSPEDLPESMDNREGWRERARDIRADTRDMMMMMMNCIRTIVIIVYKQIISKSFKKEITNKMCASKRLMLNSLVWFCFMAYQPL